MPQYPIPPWIRGADPAPHFARGYGMGQQGAEAASRVAMAQQQLAADAQRAQIEVNLKQQSIEREAIGRQQELEIAKAYNDQRVALQQQELAQAEMKIQADAEQAAQRFQAFQAYQKSIAGGADPMRATMDLLPWLPAGGQTAVIESVMRPKEEREQLEPELRTFYGPDGFEVNYLVNPKSGAPTVLHGPKEPATSPSQLSDMIKDLSSQKRALGTNYSSTEASLSTLYKNTLDEMAKAAAPQVQEDQIAQAPQVPQSPYPEGSLIKNKKDGKTYRVQNGVPVLVE